MGVSPQLLYFCERLSGFSTNYFKLEAAQTTAKSNSILSFDLPSNALLNLESFTVHFNADTYGTREKEVDGTPTTVGLNARLPPIRDLVERCEVSCGGVILSQGNNFVNVFNEARSALTGEEPSLTSGNAIMPISCDMQTGSDFDNYANQTTKLIGQTTFAIHGHELPGFIESVQPRIFDTSIIPDLRVRLYMASDNVLTQSPSGDAQDHFFVNNYPNDTPDKPGWGHGTDIVSNGASYKLSDIHASIECISLADMSYENVIASTMANQGFLEAPFKAYHTFQDTHTNTTRFSIAAQSMDRVWLAWRRARYDEQDTPAFYLSEIVGTKEQDMYYTQQRKAKSKYFTFSEPKTPQYLKQAQAQKVAEDFSTARGGYNNKKAPANPYPSLESWKMQLQLNGSYVPQYSATVQEMYDISMNSLPGRSKRHQTLLQYRMNNCVQCIRLNMVDSEFSRTLSGLDTRAVNLAGFVRTENTNEASLTVFVETTSTLRIGAGRAIELIA